MFYKLFNPQQVAVVGASRSPGKIGSLVLRNIVKGGYKGEIYPVNPKSENIQGYKSFPSVSAIESSIDLVIICVKSDFVKSVVADCIRKEVAFIVVITAGFKESSSAGADIETEIKQMVEGSNTRLLGVNCLGFIFPESNLNASFAPHMPSKGDIAIASQSGAVGTALLDYLAEYGVGIKSFISLGNETDLDITDFFENWSTDDSIKAVFAYMESVTDFKSFRIAVRRVARRKPLFIIKTGRSEHSAQVIQSHTGKLASDYKSIKKLLEQDGAVVVDEFDDFFSLMQTLSFKPITRYKKVAVVSNSGGIAAKVVDEMSQDLELATLSEETVENLKSVLPEFAKANNPLDILGDAKASRYEKALSIVVQDPNVESVIVLLTPQAISEPIETAVRIGNVSAQTDKTIVTSFIGGKHLRQSKAVLAQKRVAQVSYPEDAVQVLDYLNRYAIGKARLHRSKMIVPNKNSLETLSVIEKVFTELYNSGIQVVPDYITEAVLSSIGLQSPKYAYPSSAQESLQILKQLNGQVVMKFTTEIAWHKTDLKGVFTGLTTEDEVLTAYESIQKSIMNMSNQSEQITNPIKMQKQVNKGVELLIGIKRQGTFVPEQDSKTQSGYFHSMLFGAGGVYTELFSDVSCKAVPFSNYDLIDMISDTKVFKMLSGYRGGKKYSLSGVINTVVSLSKLVQAVPIIQDLEINPVIVNEDGSFSVDCKIRIG